MKRSEVENAIQWAKELIAKQNFMLPAFAEWTMHDFKNRSDIDVIKETMLGWDVTDYGMGKFREIGSVLFTLRNGSVVKKGVGTPYAEKLIPIMEGQRLPLHFHFHKTEDIINRGGGMIYIQLYCSQENGEIDPHRPVTVLMDGLKRTVQAGEELLIKPGNSITLVPGVYHLFGAKQGYGDVLAGEVSQINDDNQDNRFAEEISRFSQIEEDVAQTVLLCNEYGTI